MIKDKRLANYLLLVFSGVSLALLSLPLTGKVQAFKSCIAYMADPIPYYESQAVRGFVDIETNVAHLMSVDMQNRQLREEAKQMALLRAKLESLKRENERLTTTLGLTPSVEHTLRWARVMERDPLNWYRSIMVDAGSAQGVEINAPVLGLDGSRFAVVGRVIEVGGQTAKVLLLTDELSAVAAYLPSNQWEGLVQGQGSFKIRMNYLSTEAQFSIGDSVHTSPTSAVFPADLLIGTVSRVFARDPFLAFQSVEIAPAIQASRLKEVLILSRKKAASTS